MRGSLLSLNAVASSCESQGKFAEAEFYYKKVLAYREKSSDRNPQSIAWQLNRLATLYRIQKKFDWQSPYTSVLLRLIQNVKQVHLRGVAARIMLFFCEKPIERKKLTSERTSLRLGIRIRTKQPENSRV